MIRHNNFLNGAAPEIALDPACTPESIEARSFAIIEEEADIRPFSGHAWKIARRLIHTSGDMTLLDALWLPDAAISSGLRALRAGAPIFTDTQMVLSGIAERRIAPLGCKAQCFLAQKTPPAAQTSTRARAGMEAVKDSLNNAILAIGNAPTALLALLDLMREGCAAPALVIGMPVGFVNAAQSKELLIQSGLPCLVLRGRRGGSPLAAAAVNALAIIAAEGAPPPQTPPAGA